MSEYNPKNWYWIVGGDVSRAWSSASGAYVETWPETRCTRIANEPELIDVLASYGIDGPLSVSSLAIKMARRVDDDAEVTRSRYITAGSGMAMVYQEKFAQAQAVAAMGETAANAMSQADRESQFPTLSASVGIEAATLWACAQLVLAKYAQFAAFSLYIERARLAGKAAIASATDAASVRAAYAAITWPTP